MARMRHIMSPVVSLALLAIAAAATTPAIAAGNTPPSAAAATAVPNAFGGAWFVSAVFPTGAHQGNDGDPHLGVLVVIKANEVSDVNGRRCAAPRFARKQVKAETALGFAGLADQLQIHCAGQPFATLLMVPGKALAAGKRQDGTALLAGKAPVLLARRPEALYLLERAEQALYRQATIGAATVAGSAPAGPISETPVATEAPQMETPKAVAQSQPKPLTKTAAATSREKTQAKPATSAKALADATAQPSKAKAQKLQANTGPQKPAAVATTAATRKAEPASGKLAVPDIALLRSDVSGARPAQGKAASGATAAKPLAAAKPVTQQAAARATKTAPKPGMAIQLASYSGIGAATAGWQSLHSAYPELTPLKPLYVAADNAPVVHLYATGAGADKLRQICGDLQSKQAYCTISQ